jgi:polar amino acid transport system substrate-binding protein
MLRLFIHFIGSSTLILLLISATASADVLDNILKNESIRIGVALFTPYTMQDKAGHFAGFEI